MCFFNLCNEIFHLSLTIHNLSGPTSCEFTAELHDFLTEDVSKWYPDMLKDVKITLVEAGSGLLGSFDESLADYYLEKLIEKKIDVRLGTGNCFFYILSITTEQL